MTITQTVEIPASRRLTIEVPSEVPEGPAILIFKPIEIRSRVPNAVTLAAMEETENMISGEKPCTWYNSSDDFIEALKKEINS